MAKDTNVCECGKVHKGWHEVFCPEGVEMYGKCEICKKETELSEADYRLRKRKVCWNCVGVEK